MSEQDGWSRRRLLKALGIGLGSGFAPNEFLLGADNILEGTFQNPAHVFPDFSWVNQINDPRPEYAWENWEDLFYADEWLADPAVQSAPEFCAFMESAWVFNRAMEWHDEGLDGCVVCYSSVGDLPLTGENQVSSWHSDPENVITQQGEFTRFEKKSSRRRRDCAVLPCLQFHLGQHHRVEVKVTESSTDWQFCLSAKGRSGPPLASSGWREGAGEWSFDLMSELRRRGYQINFPEMHFIMGIWSKDAQSPASVNFQVSLKAQPALVACLPVIRAEQGAEAGQPCSAVALDARGQRLKSDRVKVFAECSGSRFPLEERDGFWKTRLQGLPVGDHPVKFVAEGMPLASTTTPLRVTDGRYLSLDKSSGFVQRQGRPTGPLSGSYSGTFFFRDSGQPTERMVNGQQAWNAWNDKNEAGDRLHYWEALTEKELDERFSYLAQCGFDLLYLISHWAHWERLDAGGRIAPHAAEQLAAFVRAAHRHGLSTIQALTHYPYVDRVERSNGDQTIVFNRYIEAGFKAEHWLKPGTNPVFETMFHQYIHDFLALFREETGLLALHASGEGDWKNGLARSNDIFHLVRSLDEQHMFVAEPIWRLAKLPENYTHGWDQDLLGTRTYYIGDDLFPEFDLGVEFKLYQLGRQYKAEGEWATSNLYFKFHARVLENDRGSSESWVGTERYRTRLRDVLYLSLVHRLPLVMQWDEQIAEDEHLIFKQVREQLDWTQKFMQPKVAIRVDDANVLGKGRANLAAYEQAFARLPLTYRLIPADTPASEDAAVVLDARKPYQQLGFQAEGGVLPGSLQDFVPLRLSPDYCCSYCWSADRRSLFAYIYNVTQHTEIKQWIAGRFHRIPRPTPLRVNLQNFPEYDLRYRLYDLNNKRLKQEGVLTKQARFDLGITDHDFLLFVSHS